MQSLDLTQFASAIERGVDGIWRPPAAEAISYPADGNDASFAVEERTRSGSTIATRSSLR
jgi:hypothetical protein